MVNPVQGVGSIYGPSSVTPITRVASSMSGNHSGEERVTPVTGTKAVTPRPFRPTEFNVPSPREGVDPKEMEVRSRINNQGHAGAFASAMGKAQGGSYGAYASMVNGGNSSTSAQSAYNAMTGGGSSATAAASGAQSAQTVGNSAQLPALHSELGQARVELASAELGQAKSPVADQALPAGDGRINANGEFVPRSEGASPGNNQEGECETCNNRRYVDGSDDGSVSFQSPTHISPEQSGAKVRAHEQEHVVNEQMYAEREGRKVVSQNVQIFQDCCPECGTNYVSGGLTTTVTAQETEQPAPQVQNQAPVDLMV